MNESYHENATVTFITKKWLKKKEKKYFTEDDGGKSFEFFLFQKSIYNDYNILLVSWWGTDSYFNN